MLHVEMYFCCPFRKATTARTVQLIVYYPTKCYTLFVPSFHSTHSPILFLYKSLNQYRFFFLFFLFFLGTFLS